MKFIDEAIIEVVSGDGGNGSVCFRREKYVPRGGPSGGDGGKGGDVVFIADGGLSTLMDIKFRRRFVAGRGMPGMRKQMNGVNGDDRELKLPVGTLVYDLATGELLHDLAITGERYVVARGGKGGRGNMHFATATHQAPRHAEPGGRGIHKKLRLELKLLADVGLVGLPNAGKSTLISKISNSRPKIADYPFTTKVPNLGLVRADERAFVVAVIAGLIEGAHAGAGMGTAFLKHIERTRCLVFLIDMSDPTHSDPVKSYDLLQHELVSFAAHFKKYPAIVALTKMDIPEVAAAASKACKALKKHTGHTVLTLSAATGEGVVELVREMAKQLV